MSHDEDALIPDYEGCAEPTPRYSPAEAEDSDETPADGV